MQNSAYSTITAFAASCWNQNSIMMTGNSLLFILCTFCVVFTWIKTPSFSIDLNVMALSISYAILLADTLVLLVSDISDAEQKFVSVERIRQYLDIIPEDLNKIYKK